MHKWKYPLYLQDLPPLEGRYKRAALDDRVFEYKYSSSLEVCVMPHIERGILRKLHMSHFITMIMVNVSYVICCFIDCFLE